MSSSGVTTYTYDAAGNRDSITYPNGNVTRYSYDSLNRLTELTTRDSGNNVLQRFSYTLDPTGRRTRITEASGSVTDYAYDSLYRLTDETITDPVNGNYSASYDYDKVGNRTQSVIDGVTTAYRYDANDRLSQQGGVSYSYDANGSLLSETGDGKLTRYSYNSRRQLTGLNALPGTDVSYAYDYQGNRTRAIDNLDGTTTDYVVDTNRDFAQVVMELKDGALTKQYLYGDDLIRQTQAGQPRYFHTDGLGSTRALSDNTGSLTDTYDYEAFGDTLHRTGSTDNDYLFTGEQFDPSLNQYYLRARYYDPGVGRFTQMDTFPGMNSNPETLHKYIYANADPVGVIDPSGNTGLFGFSVAQNIGAILTTANIGLTGYSVFDITTSDSSPELKAKQLGVLAILSLSGYGASKYIVGKIAAGGVQVTSKALATGSVTVLGKAKQTEILAAEFLAQKTAANVVVRGTSASGADLVVNGIFWELKTLRSASAAAVRRSFKEAIAKSQGYGRVIIDGRSAGLTEEIFKEGLASAQRFGYTNGLIEYKIILSGEKILSFP